MAVLGVPTICLVHGAAVAGGTMLAFCHDFIYVAGEASFHCNEMSNGLPLPPGMFAAIAKKHSRGNTLRDMTLFARKFTSE